MAKVDASFAALVGAGAVVAAAAVATKIAQRRAAAQGARVLVAVSGTIQDGFELRKNIDYRADGVCVEALLIGYAVVRGVKMFFDIKDSGCREYDPQTAHRVNPAMVLTGNSLDANQYALYLVDERACLNALLGEPRLLTMVPDAVRISLDDKDTSPEVAALARAFIAADGMSNTNECAVLAVVPCYQSKNFVAAPPVEVRGDGTRLTSFRGSLASFAGLPSSASPSDSSWNGAVAGMLAIQRGLIAGGAMAKIASGAVGAAGLPLPASSSAPGDKDDALYGTDKSMARLSRRLTPMQFNAMAATAGLSLRAS